MVLEGVLTMGGKLSKLSADENQPLYDKDAAVSRYETKPRLDLNDLLQRRKDERKDSTKLNVIIFSGVASVAVVVLLLLSF